jgi:endonuclease/exonuclease/phosphatase family metal-dependent hydrolase
MNIFPSSFLWVFVFTSGSMFLPFESFSLEKSSELKTLKVMSFNIRLGVAKDGPNRWDLRKDLVVNVIKKFGPDLLGLQEVFPMQATYLKENLPEYEYYGRSRSVHPQEGEACSVMYRKDRFIETKKSTFWVSETPNEPGSKSWDSSLPRIVNLVSLTDKKIVGGKLIFMNAHFDHRGKVAREEAAKIIKNRVDDIEKGMRVVITGDFNSGEGSKPYQSLVGGNLIDTFRRVHPIRTERESTFTAWNGRIIGNRIDWVLCSPDFQVLSAEINRTHEKGRYPSDHYPVTTTLNYN